MCSTAQIARAHCHPKASAACLAQDLPSRRAHIMNIISSSEGFGILKKWLSTDKTLSSLSGGSKVPTVRGHSVKVVSVAPALVTLPVRLTPALTLAVCTEALEPAAIAGLGLAGGEEGAEGPQD